MVLVFFNEVKFVYITSMRRHWYMCILTLGCLHGYESAAFPNCCVQTLITLLNFYLTKTSHDKIKTNKPNNIYSN